MTRDEFAGLVVNALPSPSGSGHIILDAYDALAAALAEARRERDNLLHVAAELRVEVATLKDSLVSTNHAANVWGEGVKAAATEAMSATSRAMSAEMALAKCQTRLSEAETLLANMNIGWPECSWCSTVKNTDHDTSPLPHDSSCRLNSFLLGIK